MALSSNEFTAPYNVSQITFGVPGAGAATTVSAFHPLFFCDKPTDILAISLNFTGVDAGQTMTVGYASTAAPGATATAFGDSTAVGGSTGIKNMNVDLTAALGVVTRVPGGQWVGVTTNNTAISASKVNVGFVKYRCPI